MADRPIRPVLPRATVVTARRPYFIRMLPFCTVLAVLVGLLVWSIGYDPRVAVQWAIGAFLGGFLLPVVVAVALIFAAAVVGLAIGTWRVIWDALRGKPPGDAQDVVDGIAEALDDE